MQKISVRVPVVAGFVMALGLGLVGSNGSSAADTKIGTVDMQKALVSVDAGKRAKTQLEKEVAAKTKEVQTEDEAIRKMANDLKKQSLVMSDEARAKKQAELQERAVKQEQKKLQIDQELHQKEQELMMPIIGKLKGIITDIARQRGYTVILEKNENMVLFSQPQDDLTADVIANYNKKGSG